MTLPFISVVTVSFNHGRFIRQNIESVLAQNYPNFEHIVVDGGSTDETVEILKSYPHLNWTSEPDRGQSHALNKGFARSRGSIVAWLNSDDWYAPNVFSEIAKALEDYPIVMGACAYTDRDGRTTEVVENIEREWFDVLKYWIYYASPAQPSIFFRKAALEEVRLDNGDYLDEDLYYCMDYELWLRLSRRYPLSRRINKIVSYFRNYEDNKSGQDMAASYREDSRVFKRHASSVSLSECRVSFVIPCDSLSPDLLRTISSFVTQRLLSIEAVIVDYNPEQKAGRELRRTISELDRDTPQFTIRYVRSDRPTIAAAAQKGCFSARAPIVAFLEPGAHVAQDFSLEASNLFEHDFIGAALPLYGKPQIVEQFSVQTGNQRSISLDALLSAQTFGFHFVARKIALLELNGIKSQGVAAVALMELFLRLLYKGWQINIDNKLSCEFAADYPKADTFLKEQGNCTVAKLACELKKEQNGDPFSAIRLKHGFGFVFPPEFVLKAEHLLNTLPQGWDRELS